MVHHHLDDCRRMRKAKAPPFRLIFLVSCCLVVFLLHCSSTAICHFLSAKDGLLPSKNTTIYCDRTAFRTDICIMRGGVVKTHSPSNSFLLLSSLKTTPRAEERIRPYPRKWETAIMDTIPELRLRFADYNSEPTGPCDVYHNATAVVFSTGGYTGNVYHEFNDGILPLYITTQHLDKRVVFVVLEYRNWWFTKYRDVLSRLSDYPPVNFSNDTKIHCFPEAIVGLRIHGDLTVDGTQMVNSETIADFRQLLDVAYSPRIRSLEQEEEQEKERSPQSQALESLVGTQKPKLVIVSRNGSRAIENEGQVVRLAEEVGFRVKVLRPERTTELAKIYRVLNSSDAMIGVHGAAMTHFLFMRPGSVFIQIVPLGTRWAAETYYGDPAVKMGLWYSAYRIRPEESSLSQVYEKGNPVLREPDAVTAKGWQETKRVYLEGQNVRLDGDRFHKLLIRAHRYLFSKKHGYGQQQQQC